nr:ABC transporter permease [Modestobacter roseus]
MTTVLAAPPRLHRVRARWAWGLGALVVVGWALAAAGLFTGEVVNRSGTAQFGRFAAAALSPELD